MQYSLLERAEICQIYREHEKVLDKTISDIVQWLDREGGTVATAESCTGGLLSQLLTAVPGASRVFELGLCTYAAQMKTKLLGVPATEIVQYGVVSAQVAYRMVCGLYRLTNAQLCLSVTGIAGPGGGTSQQPVGTVYVGMLLYGKAIIAPLQLQRYGLHTREEIRYGTAVCAFGIAKRGLVEEAACRKKKNLQ